MTSNAFTPEEMMIVAASRLLHDDDVCLVGIGAPSAACNLARLSHAPLVRLVYESGTIDTRPDVLPLSIGDGELCQTSRVTVSLPEIFRYWIQGGRITVGFLGAAQIDRFANINTTVIGDYERPDVRLPGAGGAPEIGTGCQQTFVILPMTPKHFVAVLPFRTTLGFGDGGDHRARLGLRTLGPTCVVTDLCVLEPDPESKELTVVSLHPGVTRDHVAAACGWPLRFSDPPTTTPPPSDRELGILRDLQERTRLAHQGK
jgi:glutaconate CoA-transferase subunit B